MPPARRTRRPLVALLVLLALLGVGYTARALDGGKAAGPSATTMATTAPGVALTTLPAPVQRTVGLIRAGGPFPYQRDGVVFRNDEHRLPARPAGYYREYTVPTPGEADRGARRIIAGAGGDVFYTADHYASFIRVDVTR